MGSRSPVSATADQREALQKLAGSADRGEADRARGVLLTLNGWTSPRIAEAFGLREDTERSWRSAFLENGVAGLTRRVAPGASPHRAQAALRVAAVVLGDPVANRTNWTLPRLAAEIERREGVSISRSRLSVVLRQKGGLPGGGRGTR